MLLVFSFEVIIANLGRKSKWDRVKFKIGKIFVVSHFSRQLINYEVNSWFALLTRIL